MLSADQSSIVEDLIRKHARILRKERHRTLRLVNSLISAREACIPEQFLLPFSSGLHRFIESAPFDQSALPSEVTMLFVRNQRCGIENLAALENFGSRIRREFGVVTEDSVLAGDGAALAGLYQDPGAFPASDWVALLKDGVCANGSKHKQLGPPAEEWSEKTKLGDALWRRPKPALLITLFAGQIGDPTISPTPPKWPHLGLALLIWKDRIGVDEVLKLGSALGQRNEVERGLAIAAHIFPELTRWADVKKMNIPRWESKLAVPLAARRLVFGERG
jgi:hypothetical protein